MANSDLSKIEGRVLKPYANQLVRIAAALGFMGCAERLLDEVDLSPVLDDTPGSTTRKDAETQKRLERRCAVPSASRDI